VQQSEVMSKAFEHAKIQIVGGDGQFFDKFISAISLGQSVDSVLDQSDTLKSVLGEYLGNGHKNGDLKDILAGAAGEEGGRSPTISALLARLASGADDDARAKISKLAARAKEMGIDDLTAP